MNLLDSYTQLNTSTLKNPPPSVEKISSVSKSKTPEKLDKKKLAYSAAAAIGIAALCGAGIYLGKIKPKNTVEQITDITQDGIGKLLKENDKLTGKFSKTLKDGSKVVIEYSDGVLQKSTKTAADGTQIFEKVYSKTVNGDLLVNNKNITEISNRAKKHQEDFANLMKKQNSSLDELQSFDKSNLSKKQIIELDGKIETKQKIELEIKKHQEDFANLMKKQNVSLDELQSFNRKNLSKKQIGELDGKIKAKKEAVKLESKSVQDASSRTLKEKLALGHKENNACFVQAEDMKAYDAAMDTIEQTRGCRFQYIERSAKKGYFDEDELELLRKYKDKTLDNLDEIFEKNGDKPIDKLYILAKNNLDTKGTSLVLNEIPEIFDGLEPKAIEKAIDELSHCVSDGTLQIANKQFNVTVIGGGTYNKVARISDNAGKSVVLRVAKNANPTRSACEEIATSLNLTKNNIADVPKFYMGNPLLKRTYTDNFAFFDTGCWQICEYVTDTTPIRNGKKLFDYLQEIGGKHMDLNSGAFVGDYIVDYGGILGDGMGGLSKLCTGGILDITAKNPEITLNETIQKVEKLH